MSPPLIGGTADATHPAVVAIVGRRPQCSSPEDLTCSGTLIGPRAVLTAAHCLEGREPDELEVITGAAVDAADRQVIAVWGARVHPDYDPLAAPALQHDLAVLFLASAPPITPATWAESEPPGFGPGANLTAVAYGAVSAVPNASSGQRLSAPAEVLALNPASMHVTGGTACGGDSGGALFFATAGGDTLIGVIKGSSAGCTDPTIAMRADEEAGFVREALAAAAASVDPGRPPLDLTEGVCTAACVEHADCPLGMLCLPDRGESFCGWRDVRIGAVGDACADGAPDCISVGQGAERSCRRFTECAYDEGPEGCCAAGGDPTGSLALAAAVLALLFTSHLPRRAAGDGSARRTRTCR